MSVERDVGRGAAIEATVEVMNKNSLFKDVV